MIQIDCLLSSDIRLLQFITQYRKMKSDLEMEVTHTVVIISSFTQDSLLMGKNELIKSKVKLK